MRRSHAFGQYLQNMRWQKKRRRALPRELQAKVQEWPEVSERNFSLVESFMKSFIKLDAFASVHYCLQNWCYIVLQRCMVFDFLPKDPTAPQTAVSLLSGGSSPGIVRETALRRVPRRRCIHLGSAKIPKVSISKWRNNFKIVWHNLEVFYQPQFWAGMSDFSTTWKFMIYNVFSVR